MGTSLMGPELQTHVIVNERHFASYMEIDQGHLVVEKGLLPIREQETMPLVNHAFARVTPTISSFSSFSQGLSSKLGSSQTWLFQTWLFAIFALFCAVLRSFADLRLCSFARICALAPSDRV